MLLLESALPGNLDKSTECLEYYVDIDTWVSQNGYVDYLMPQIYWGFDKRSGSI